MVKWLMGVKRVLEARVVSLCCVRESLWEDAVHKSTAVVVGVGVLQLVQVVMGKDERARREMKEYL